MRRTTGFAITAAAMAAAVLAAVSAAQAQDGAAARSADPGEGAPPMYTEQDLRFLRHMIDHHQQALDMSALVPERTEREALIRFARYVAGAQAAEIDVMRSLLALAADRGQTAAANDSHDSHDSHASHSEPPMAGMLSQAQMDALAEARGARFERLWLEGMIYHHQGALEMARAQQLQQLETGRRPYGIDVLVEDILVEQRAEITRMREWLLGWGLAEER